MGECNSWETLASAESGGGRGCTVKKETFQRNRSNATIFPCTSEQLKLKKRAVSKVENISEILGVPFSKRTLQETTLLLTEQIKQDSAQLLHLITANPEIVMASQSDEQLRTIIQEADVATPDGIGVVIASRWSGNRIPERVTGYDLLLQLLEKGNQLGWRFYLLGADEETSRKAAEIISNRYPNVLIVGRHHGFFTEMEEDGILADLQQTKPDILFVAMGAPYSDKWIYKHKGALASIKVAFGVGGSLDVIAGKAKRAPVVWQKLNLEWLYRLFSVPAGKGQKSRWRRQSALPKFIYKTMIRR
jgi:N-acetylglucosaminyldiphosphoundecaprenol N-acetyl-beta-D-mannosaminyltransferase